MIVKTVPSFAAAVADAKKTTLTAAINTVNIAAAVARKNAQQNIYKNFTIRNSFTQKSILFTKCDQSVKKFSEIKSLVGATERAGYMARQESGGAKRSETGANLVIPTTTARGGSEANKLPRKFFYTNIKKNIVGGTPSTSKTRGRKGNSVAQAYVAAKTGKFVRRNDAIFAVTNFQKPKREEVSFRLVEVLNLKHPTTITPADPWLEPATEKPAKDLQKIFNAEMKKI